MALEFREEGFSRPDLELLDSCMEHRRWYRQRSKALYRDWERDRRELKERTV